MKILHINKDYGNNGGTEQYLYDLCDALEMLGHQVVIIYGNRDKDTWHAPGRREYFISGVHEFSNRANCKTLKACADIIEREEPDVINLHITSNPSLVDKLKEVRPLTRSVHTPYLYCLRTKLFRTTDTICTQPFGYHCLLNTYLKRCADPRPWGLKTAWQRCKRELESNKKVTRTIVFSKYMRNCLVQNGFEEDKVTTLSYFASAPAQARQNSQSDENLILYVGRITYEKGLVYLLKAAKQISLSYRLLVIGEGWYLKRAKLLAKELGLRGRVEFPGWISNESLGRYYSKCSVLVVPSIWPEPFGIVGLEAMSYAKPVIAFNVGGISDWLEDCKTGFLVEPGNVDEMVAKIELLLRDKELAKKMGESGQQKVRTSFSTAGHVHRLLQVYEQAIADSRA